MKAPLSLLATLAASLVATSAHAQTLPSNLNFSCGAKAPGDAMIALREASATPEAQAADLAAAQKAITRANTIRQDALAGRTVEAPYAGVAAHSGRALAATKPRTAELFRRAAQDQLGRGHFTAASRRISWASGLSDNALGYAFKILAKDGCGVDVANTAWLKRELDTGGWFTISADGPEADKAAFILVQHADQDPDFQIRTLSLLESLARKGETNPRNYAMLHDRISVLVQDRPQRYGSQGRCTAPGVWTPFTVEDPANLDQRRAAMGLPPEADYVMGISARACAVR